MNVVKVTVEIALDHMPSGHTDPDGPYSGEDLIRDEIRHGVSAIVASWPERWNARLISP